MGRKGKKSGEKGPSPPSPQGPQSSPASKGGGKQPSTPGEAVTKDKASKKQKASPPTKSTKEREVGKANGRESEDAKKTVGQKRKTSQGGATTKAKGGCCSLFCVFLLSVLVAFVAAVGYAAYVAYPAESQQLIGELETHTRRFARSVSEFVNAHLDKILNAEPKAADEPSPEARKSAEDDSVESHRNAGESSKEEDEELESRGVHESESAEEFDRVEEEIVEEETTSRVEGEKVIEPADVFEEEEEKFEPETIVVEEDDIGGIVEERAKETTVGDGDDDDDAEFEEHVASELEQDDNEFDDEDGITTQGHSHDQGSTREEEEHFEDPTDDSRKEDVAEEQIQKEETLEQEFETAAEDDAVEFEEEADEVLEQDVDEGDGLRWELAGDRGEGEEEHLEKPSDVIVEDVREDRELRHEESPERFENVQEMKMEHVPENEQKVSGQEDIEKPEDKPPKVPLPQEPAAPVEVPHTEVPAQEASAEQIEEKLHFQEVPGELPKQVPTQEPLEAAIPDQEVSAGDPEVVTPDQEVSMEEAYVHEEPGHDTTSASDPEVVIPSQDGDPGLQAPADVHSSHEEDLVEEVAQAESQVTVDSDLADQKSSEEIVQEGSDHRHGRETESEQREEVQEIRQHAVKEADGKDPEESDFQSRDPGGIQENLEEKVNTGELPKVADSADVQLEKELDDIDAIIDKAPREAIVKYDLLLSVHPESSRAIVGKAKALGVLADIEQNDDVLEQSIAEYQKVFSLRGVPKSLMVEAARACAERQTIRGWVGAAAQTLHSLVSMYSDDLELYNELGRKYLVNGAYDEARATFKEILNKDPNDAFAMLYLGYIMKSVDHELDQSLSFMRAGLATVPVSDMKFYMELGEALTRTKRHTEALEVYQLAVDRQLLKSIWQRSWFNEEGLSSRVWWTPQQTNYLSNLQVLEDFKNIIREEADAVLINKSSLFIQDGSDFIETGELKHMKLYINGRKVTESCQAVARTCGLLDAFSDAVDCKQCEVKLSLMQPGLHLLPRCGPTNCRLTAHLPLVVAPQTRIRVADEMRTYVDGGLLIFDDSFEQELWVAGDAPQLLLTIEMWHPDLTFEQKSTLGPL